MTTEKLLSELEKQRDAVNAAISLIKQVLHVESNSHKGKRILKSIEDKKPKAPTAHSWSKTQRAKFIATMKARYPNRNYGKGRK